MYRYMEYKHPEELLWVVTMETLFLNLYWQINLLAVFKKIRLLFLFGTTVLVTIATTVILG